MASILVTGGCGFIGTNLIPRLLNNGFSVRVLDNSTRESCCRLPAGVEFIQGDVRDRSLLKSLLAEKPLIVHLAAYGSVYESVIDPVANFENNVIGTFTLLDECRIAGVKKLIFSSTGGALMGNKQPPVDENTVPEPISPYGASKLCCEAYCSAMANAYNMDIIVLRFANIVGPYSLHKKGVITNFMKAIIEDKELIVYGDGSSTRDYLYVDDLCDGIILALKSNLKGYHYFHLAHSEEISLNKLLETLKNVTKRNFMVRYENRRVGEVNRNFAKYDKAERILGFRPKTSLKEAIEKTWRWYQDHHLKKQQALTILKKH